MFITLRERLGAGSVFMDVENIAPGRDFRHVLTEHLASINVMLVLIGRDWLDARDKTGKRRIDDPNDFVRQEIRAALARDIVVTPVLLQGAQMPSDVELPADLRDLAFRNALEISHTRWESDVDQLIQRMGLVAATSAPSEATERVAMTSPPATLQSSTSSQAGPATRIESPPEVSMKGSALRQAAAAPSVNPEHALRRFAWPIAFLAVLAVGMGIYVYVQRTASEQARLEQSKAVEQARAEAAAKARAESETEAQARRRQHEADLAEARTDAADVHARPDRQAGDAKAAAELAAKARANAQTVADATAARDAKKRADLQAAAVSRGAAARKSMEPSLPPKADVLADTTGKANVIVDPVDADRRLADIRAGRFSGSMASSLGDYAVAWGIAPNASIGRPIPARALSGGVASRPCGFLARQIPADEHDDFLATCLALPAYGVQSGLPLGVRPSEQQWMAFCTSRADATNSTGEGRVRMMRNCLRVR